MLKRMKTLAQIVPMGGLLIGGGLMGCKTEDPIQPVVLAQKSGTSARAVLASTSKGAVFLESDDSMVAKLGSRASNPPLVTKSGQSVMMMLSRSVPPLRAVLGNPEKKATLAGQIVFQTTDTATTSQRLDDSGKDLEVLLKERILVDANLETKDDSSATYLLKPVPTCDPLPSDGPGATPDPECVADLMKLPVRVVMTADGDGARLRVLIGSERAELIVFIVHSNELAVEVDLASMKKAAEIADAALGDGSPSSGSDFKQFGGKVRASLRKDGEQVFTASASILNALAIETVDAMGRSEGWFKSEARNPVVSFTADNATKTLTATENLGVTEIGAKWDPRNTGVPNTDLHVVLGGLTGSTTMQDMVKKLEFKGLGYGAVATHVDVRGQTIFQLDFNPNNGRKMDATVTLTAADEPIISMTPVFDLGLGFKLNAVASDLDTAPEPEVADEHYRAVLDGATPVVIESVPENTVTGWKGGVKVVAGKLAITSTSKPTTVTVDAGQCLVSKTAAATDNKLVGALGSAACP